MSREKLLELVRPVYAPRPSHIDEDTRTYRERVAKWQRMVPAAIDEAIRTIVHYDKLEEAIPRDAVILLGVATNQFRRNRWELYADKELLARAIKLCRRFKAGALLDSSSSNGPVGNSTLEKRLDEELAKKVKGHCRRCGAVIWADESVRRGYGSVCIGKVTLSRGDVAQRKERSARKRSGIREVGGSNPSISIEIGAAAALGGGGK